MPVWMATDPAGYEKYIGRWSHQLASAFVTATADRALGGGEVGKAAEPLGVEGDDWR